ISEYVDQLDFRLVARRGSVARPQVFIRKRLLRIPVEHFHPRVGWDSVEVEIEFLDVLAVISLRTRQSEEALFQDWILTVPQCHRQAYVLEPIAESAQPILIPPKRPSMRVLEGKACPCATVLAVVFPYGAPGAVTYVRSPVLPIGLARCGSAQALVFGCRHVMLLPVGLRVPVPVQWRVRRQGQLGCVLPKPLRRAALPSARIPRGKPVR